MQQHDSPAPARPLLRCAGAFVLFATLCVTACDRDKAGIAKSDEKGPRTLQFGHDTMKVPDSVHVATVRIDHAKQVELEPATISVRTGDFLRFIASDAGAHAIAFDGASMSADARAFLEKTGQMRSPPFLAADASWVLNLKGAPAGTYSYQCPTHGARGTITVTAR